jgi:hypothetical protein
MNPSSAASVSPRVRNNPHHSGLIGAEETDSGCQIADPKWLN